MKFMKFISLFVLLGTLLGSGGALATTTTIRALPGDGLINGTVGVNQFEDYWTFNLGSASDIAGQVNNNIFAYAALNLTFQDIAGLAINLYGAALGSAVTDPLTYSEVTGDNAPSATILSFNSLAAGSYALKISGTGTGILGGRYSGNLSTKELAPAVPEPETWVMLLVGTLLLALQLRRKIAIQNSMLISA